MKDKLFDFIEKFTEEKHVNAIKDGMIAYVPFTIINSIVLLFAFFPSQVVIDFVTKITGSATAWDWQGKLLDIGNGAMNIGAVICLIFISYNLAKSFKKIDPIFPAVLSLGVYMILIPVTDGNLNMAYLSPTSLIVAILVGLLIPETYNALIKTNFKIKLPEQVPYNVIKSFESLIPMAIIIVAGFILKVVIASTSYGDIHALINGVIALPLLKIGGSLPGYIIACLLTGLLWIFGIHGNNIIMSGIMAPILVMMTDANRLAFQTGEPIPYILTNEFLNYTGGAILWLAIMSLFIAKSKQMRTVSKIGIVPGLFSIHEPLVFGYPVIFNPILGVYFVLMNGFGPLLTYIVTALGLVPRMVAVVPWTMPPGIYGFLATGGNIIGGLWQLILGGIFMVLAIPFIKAYDKILLEKEKSKEAAVGMKEA